MGRLSGFRYRDFVCRLNKLGFLFDRQAVGSHEIWFNAATGRYTTIPKHPGDLPEGTLRAILKLADIKPCDGPRGGACIGAETPAQRRRQCAA